ncbi:MAG: CDP-diacylglycerol--glycerol-3-phosphate 3-phosphatidyltransferase [Pseudanabaenaceae cyanobacterium]
MTLQTPSTITLPTWITLTRLLAVPVILLSAVYENWPAGIGAIAFAVAALTDWLDGYLARRLHCESDLGKMLDPLVDKILVMAPLLVLVQRQAVPAWGVFLILARELTVTAWRGGPQTGVVGANLWGKAKTVCQIAAVLLLWLHLPGALPVFWGAVALTLISGWLYLA